MIRIVEVGPRDGLQNEVATVPTDVKVRFIEALADAGLIEIEASAFVAPKWVPQLTDAADVFARVERRPGVTYSALVPNEKGLDRALAANVDRIAVFTGASETFNQKNVNTSIAGSLERFATVLRRARAADLPVRGYVSTAFWCPYEGKVDPAAVIEVSERLLELGVEEIALGDTIGKATAEEVVGLLERIAPRVGVERLAMHFHDTYGNAIENVRVSYAHGVRGFDASAGGLGGCPYAPGATGNVATASVVRALRELGAEVPVDLEKLNEAWEVVVDSVGRDERPLPSQPTPT